MKGSIPTLCVRSPSSGGALSGKAGHRDVIPVSCPEHCSMAYQPPGWWPWMVQEPRFQPLWRLCPLLVFILGISSQSARETLPLWWWPVCLLPPIRPRPSSLALAPKVTPRLIPKVSFLAPPEQNRAFSCGSPNHSSGIHPFPKALRQNINFLAWC